MADLHFAHRTDTAPFFFKVADRFKWDRNLVACVICELFCSFFLMYGGLSINATQTIQNKVTHINKFDYGIAMSWGAWLALTGYLGNALSGPHCNPAFSFMFYVLGAIKLKRCLLYIVVQFIGCYLGSLFVFIIYFDGISDFDGGHRQVRGDNATAGIFATYPRDYLSVAGGFIDQFFTTAILAIIAVATSDVRTNVPKMAQPAIMGVALWAIISQWSHNCGAALNPARDFGPRLMTLTVGYGWEVISYNNYKYFWIPIVAPMLGALAGAYLYKIAFGDYLSNLGHIDSNDGRRGTRGMSLLSPSRISSSHNFQTIVPRGNSFAGSPNPMWTTMVKEPRLSFRTDPEQKISFKIDDYENREGAKKVKKQLSFRIDDLEKHKEEENTNGKHLSVNSECSTASMA